MCTPVIQNHLRDLFWGASLRRVAAGHGAPRTVALFALALSLNLALLPAIALYPPLEEILLKLAGSRVAPIVDVEWRDLFLLHLPAAKFLLSCTSDLALALSLLALPAPSSLPRPAAAPLLLLWIGASVVKEAKELADPLQWAADRYNLMDASALLLAAASLLCALLGDDETTFAFSRAALGGALMLLLLPTCFRLLSLSQRVGPLV